MFMLCRAPPAVPLARLSMAQTTTIRPAAGRCRGDLAHDVGDAAHGHHDLLHGGAGPLDLGVVCEISARHANVGANV